MTRNEEIRQEALNWKTDDNEFIAQTAFEAGAKWADEHQKSPWISVKDRLPDYEQDCLLSYESAFIEIGGRYTKESGVPYLDENGFVTKRNGGRYTGDVVHVDYWMPIPELQKGGEK